MVTHFLFQILFNDVISFSPVDHKNEKVNTQIRFRKLRLIQSNLRTQINEQLQNDAKDNSHLLSRYPIPQDDFICITLNTNRYFSTIVIDARATTIR